MAALRLPLFGVAHALGIMLFEPVLNPLVHFLLHVSIPFLDFAVEFILVSFDIRDRHQCYGCDRSLIPEPTYTGYTGRYRVDRWSFSGVKHRCN